MIGLQPTPCPPDFSSGLRYVLQPIWTNYILMTCIMKTILNCSKLKVSFLNWTFKKRNILVNHMKLRDQDGSKNQPFLSGSDSPGIRPASRPCPATARPSPAKPSTETPQAAAYANASLLPSKATPSLSCSCDPLLHLTTAAALPLVGWACFVRSREDDELGKNSAKLLISATSEIAREFGASSLLPCFSASGLP
jgi:hypothetical protein